MKTLIQETGRREVLLILEENVDRIYASLFLSDKYVLKSNS